MINPGEKAAEARWGKKTKAGKAGKREPLRCPMCGTSKVVKILYGLPPHPAPKIDRSKYVRGGYSVRLRECADRC